jgi:hypothetical protein
MSLRLILWRVGVNMQKTYWVMRRSLAAQREALVLERVAPGRVIVRTSKFPTAHAWVFKAWPLSTVERATEAEKARTGERLGLCLCQRHHPCLAPGTVAFPAHGQTEAPPWRRPCPVPRHHPQTLPCRRPPHPTMHTDTHG